jgi:hypothetical protein
VTYRFFDNAKVVPERILERHIEATYRRMSEEPVVLAVQDTTFFNWEHHPVTQGLGPISDRGRGMVSHGTLAVTPERLVLGVLAQHSWIRASWS